MIQNHVISFTKEELQLIHKALLTVQGESGPFKKPRLRATLGKVETALTAEPAKKEIWPRDWTRDIETIGGI